MTSLKRIAVTAGALLFAFLFVSFAVEYSPEKPHDRAVRMMRSEAMSAFHKSVSACRASPTDIAECVKKRFLTDLKW